GAPKELPSNAPPCGIRGVGAPGGRAYLAPPISSPPDRMFNPPRAVGRPDRRWHLALTGVLLALVAALASPAHAQSIDVPRASSPLQLGQRLGTEAALGLPTAPREGALDPARYLASPGGVSALTIGRPPPAQ